MREFAAETGARIGSTAADEFRLVIIEDDDAEGPAGAAGETAQPDAGEAGTG